MKTTRRIYRTADGTLVLEGHADAVALAYGQDDDVENRDQDAVRDLLEPDVDGDEPEPKQAEQAPDKAVRRTRNKSG